MAAVEVTISGMLYDKIRRTMQNVVLIGEASLTGVGVGGGPLPGGPGGGGPVDPGFGNPWFDPHPSHPIVLPGDPSWPPGTRPPQVPVDPGYGVDVGTGPVRPTHPIALPPWQPPPPPSGGTKPPPPEGGWGFSPEYGWGYFPGIGEATPKV